MKELKHTPDTKFRVALSEYQVLKFGIYLLFRELRLIKDSTQFRSSKTQTLQKIISIIR